MSKIRTFATTITLALVLALAVLPAVPAFAQSAAAALPGERLDRAALESFVGARQAVAEIERRATARRAAELGLPLRQELPDGTILELARFSPEGRPLYRITDNLNAARTVSTDDVWSGGSAGLALTGAGQPLAIWDGGSVRNTHQELAGRVTLDESVALSAHSTHVAGTMIGTGLNAAARGMANAATLRSWDFNSDETEMAAAQLGGTPPVISNHSYGYISGWNNGSFGCSNGNDPQWYFFGDVTVSGQEDLIFGLYEETAAAWDEIVFASPDYLIFKSAGNDRGDGPGTQPVSHCQWNSTLGTEGDFEPSTAIHPIDGGATGFDTIGGGAGSAKNVITVGAVNDIPAGYAGPASVVMSNFSGWGPVDDGRIKPDVVANGTSLTSSTSTSNTSYGSLSGTSMSTPNASGSAATLRQHATSLGQSWRGATYKALIIHTADEAGANPGPDYSFGWGLMNTTSAALLLSGQQATHDRVYQATLANGGSVSRAFVTTGGGPPKATLAWTDPPGEAARPERARSGGLAAGQQPRPRSRSAGRRHRLALDPRPGQPGGGGDHRRQRPRQRRANLRGDAGRRGLHLHHQPRRHADRRFAGLQPDRQRRPRGRHLRQRLRIGQHQRLVADLALKRLTERRTSAAAATVRSTSPSVVCQLEAETRITRLPRQVLAPKKTSPVSTRAAITASVRRSWSSSGASGRGSGKRSRPWLITGVHRISAPGSAPILATRLAGVMAQQRSTRAATPFLPSWRKARVGGEAAGAARPFRVPVHLVAGQGVVGEVGRAVRHGVALGAGVGHEGVAAVVGHVQPFVAVGRPRVGCRCSLPSGASAAGWPPPTGRSRRRRAPRRHTGGRAAPALGSRRRRRC